jgi:UDP-glucose 4-epimerase
MTTSRITTAHPDLAVAFAGKRVAVTGGAGFIGSHLTATLAALGAEVTVVDNLSGGSRANLYGVPCRILDADITHRPALKRCLAGATIIFHQAALGSVPRSIEDPANYVNTNILGTTNVLEYARTNGCQRVIFAASSSAYGDSPTLPKHEAMPPSPMSPYAATKVAGEQLMHAYAACYPLTTVSLRYFNVFGPRQSATSAYAAVIAAFAAALLEGRRPIIYGDGEQSRDFTPVDNVVLANLLAATAAPERVSGKVFNVGCGRRITINELATQMATLTGRPDLTPDHHPPRTGDVPHSLADLTRATADLGYQPITHFETALAETVEWYRATATR